MENRIEISRVKIVTTISDFASNNCAITIRICQTKYYCPSFFIKVVRCQLVEQEFLKMKDGKPKHYQFHVYYEAEALTSTLIDLTLLSIISRIVY